MASKPLSKEKDPKPHYHGHRARLKARFLRTDGDGMEDYELLELLLFQGIPRRDVKPLAKQLLQKFGSFAEVVSAPKARLMEVEGMGESAIVALKVARSAAIRLAQEHIMDKPVLSNWKALLDYCRASMAYHQTEMFRVLFLDKHNRLIADEIQQEGTVDETPVYPREVIKRALELGASAIILVHNHPSGKTDPSSADVALTEEIVAAAKKLDIKVHDHVIVSKSSHLSFKSAGLI